jgi:hypothetical protein
VVEDFGSNYCSAWVIVSELPAFRAMKE